jgi:four helix bundle protein
MGQGIKHFEELQCRKLSLKLYFLMNEHAKKEKWHTDDDLVCRWLVSSVQISSKIAFAFWAEDYEWFVERLPLARKYCFECAFWTEIMVQKGKLSPTKAKEYHAMIKSVLKKVNAIIKYLEKYGHKEQYDRKMFFERVER